MSRAGLRVKLRAVWRAPELDEALAGGTDPTARGELTLHALKLADPAHRLGLARTLELIIDHVSGRGLARTPGPAILRREPIKSNRAELLALARRLRLEGFHCIRGLAMADRLIRFGDSPLYMALGPEELRNRVADTLAALEPGWDGCPADMPGPEAQ
jgi:hypothetical protein